MPMKFRISSEYGVLEEIRDGRVHKGIDLAMPRGTELHSIAEGTVDRVVNSPTLGNGVMVRTDDGDVHIYGHLDKVTVHAGQHVDAGDLIGLSGSTGHSTGPHLHFGLIHDGQVTDPTPLVNAVQHFSGEIAGPAFLGIHGPASWLGTGIISGARHHLEHQIIHWAHEIGLAILDLSYGAALISCSLLIILGALGLKNGYRWAGLVFGGYALIRMLGSR